MKSNAVCQKVKQQSKKFVRTNKSEEGNCSKTVLLGSAQPLGPKAVCPLEINLNALEKINWRLLAQGCPCAARDRE